MKRKLPNLYKGRVKNNSNNQKQSIINSIEENITELIDEENDDFIEKKSVNRQIKDIFSSPSFVYKANVTITMFDGNILKKTIIGRTNNSLITIDDELIDVSKISQIDFN